MSSNSNYHTPECSILELRFDGIMCVSTFPAALAKESSSETFDPLTPFEW